MKIYESTFYQFELDEDRIVNRWKDTTDKMTFQDFKDALMTLAGYVIEYRTPKILIDTTNFKFQLPPENVEFRNEVFYPRVTKVGAVKQALIMPKEYLQYVKDEIGSDVVVPTRYFSDESEATAWLDSSE
ncbi:MAG: STAS/SEC14 domain-containing protein [Candidatus Levybacteria bacterium]|nr:STAS/SEC14 domain-containing protein [Candidatus Levybacteria bacterium]